MGTGGKEGSRKVKELRRAWGTGGGGGEEEMRTEKQVKGNETSFFIYLAALLLNQVDRCGS